jgi:hypothetical protein
MIACAVVTTFPDNQWQGYAKAMLESFVTYWPQEVPVLVQLDSDLLGEDVHKLLRPLDGIKCGWEKDHADFVARNAGKDDPQNYRKQAARFCHKVFALKYALDATKRAKEGGAVDAPRYLIWLDADVLTTRKVTIDDIQQCLPKDKDACSYLGRKDWGHSECGFLAFDLDNGGGDLINAMVGNYQNDRLLSFSEWHDSWVFDVIRNESFPNCTNLTLDKPGMDIWPESPMAAWSRHYKGPIAKQELLGVMPQQNTMRPLKIQTKNSIPDLSIQQNILENQSQITQWLRPCLMTDEEIVIVSAGPQLIAEDLLAEQAKGRKIVAVKHALEPLRDAGVKPWACILLDPREHMSRFTEKPDTDVIWLVASQVIPRAVKQLLDAGCNVWGYHAPVGAGEDKYTCMQPDAIVHGGSATATRGMFVLEKLGFRRFRLYGYDLCVPDKPDLSLRDEYGQPKYFEISLDANMPHYKAKRAFWSTGELLAQYEEFKGTILTKDWEVLAFGNGIAPFIANAKRVSDLRGLRKKDKMPRHKTISCEALLCHKPIPYLARLRKRLRNLRRKPIAARSY